MQHQRQTRNRRLYRPQAVAVDLAAGRAHQVGIADRHRQRVHTGFQDKAGGFVGVGRARNLPCVVADVTQFRLDRDAKPVRHCHDFGGTVDIGLQRQRRAVIHHRGKAAVDGLTAQRKVAGVIKMGDNRHKCCFGQTAKHRAKHWQRRVGTASGAGLQNDRTRFGLGGGDIGARILPAQHHQTGHRSAIGQAGAQHLGKAGDRHLNLAIMSLIPGMVSI